jgi:hypothetical protein
MLYSINMAREILKQEYSQFKGSVRGNEFIIRDGDEIVTIIKLRELEYSKIDNVKFDKNLKAICGSYDNRVMTPAQLEMVNADAVYIAAYLEA